MCLCICFTFLYILERQKVSIPTCLRFSVNSSTQLEKFGVCSPQKVTSNKTKGCVNGSISTSFYQKEIRSCQRVREDLLFRMFWSSWDSHASHHRTLKQEIQETPALDRPLRTYRGLLLVLSTLSLDIPWPQNSGIFPDFHSNLGYYLSHLGRQIFCSFIFHGSTGQGERRFIFFF